MTEQVLIRNLPDGTKARLAARAERHQRSMEAEARAILDDALSRDADSIVDILAMPESADIEFEPGRLGASARSADL